MTSMICEVEEVGSEVREWFERIGLLTLDFSFWSTLKEE